MYLLHVWLALFRVYFHDKGAVDVFSFIPDSSFTYKYGTEKPRLCTTKSPKIGIQLLKKKIEVYCCCTVHLTIANHVIVCKSYKLLLSCTCFLLLSPQIQIIAQRLLLEKIALPFSLPLWSFCFVICSVSHWAFLATRSAANSALA